MWRNGPDAKLLNNVVEGLQLGCGLCFPFNGIGLLGTCWQVRDEALMLAYRKTRFQLRDIDEVTQFLIAVGSIGRQNLRSLEFAWTSRTDCDIQWSKAPPGGDFTAQLPSLHVEECTKLLKECHNLNFLCLKFDSIIIADTSPEMLKDDPGLRQLCSVRSLPAVEIVDLAGDPLGPAWFVEWLSAALGHVGT